jgi:methyl acetate hydrolase
VAERENSVPGVVTMATDRRDNFYEGAAGKRELGKDQEMTTDNTVLAIFSCTKAVTGVTVMQLSRKASSASTIPIYEAKDPTVVQLNNG